MLGEDGGRGLQDFAQHALSKLHQVAGNYGPCPLPVVERDRIVAELDADFREDTVGRLLDANEVFFGQDIVGRNVAQDKGPAQPLRTVAALLAPCFAPATLAFCTGFCLNGHGFLHRLGVCH